LLTAKRLSLATALFLAGCAGSGSLPEFSTEGVNAPPATCSVDPREFSDAESIGSMGKGACTARNMYRINMIEGVRLSQPAYVNCAVANGFRNWLQDVAQPAARASHGSTIASVEVAASYACRPRNGRRGAKLSEHGLGNAIDVSAFKLSDGTELSVKSDYYGSQFLKRVRQQACGIFKTVLGPGSDASHKDHFHFDLANRSSGQTYCR
jgi:hypothetical protein